MIPANHLLDRDLYVRHLDNTVGRSELRGVAGCRYDLSLLLVYTTEKKPTRQITALAESVAILFVFSTANDKAVVFFQKARLEEA